MNIFEILGLPSDTPKEELEKSYKALRYELSEKRFLPGEEGNAAAKKLSELDTAWKDYNAFNEGEKVDVGVDSDFSKVEEYLKQGDYAEAQNLLDSIKTRNAEWHYYQSQVYYRREWLTESRKHLKIAVDMEPGNEKYKNALAKLEMKMGNSEVPPQNFGNYNQQQQMQGASCGNMLSDCCAAYCCMECCYSLFCCR